MSNFSWRQRYRRLRRKWAREKLPRRPRKRKPKKERSPPQIRRRPNPEVITASGIRRIVYGDYTGAVYSVEQTAVSWDRYRRSYESAYTPAFKDKKRKKRLPLNPYQSRKRWSLPLAPYVSHSLNLVTGFTQDITQPAQYQDTFFPSAYGFNHTNEAEYLARARLAKAVNDLKFNAGVAFAERKQTAALIQNTATRLYFAARCLRKADLRGLYESLGLDGQPDQRQIRRVMATPPSKRLANHWLEYNFGWVPLLNDVTGAAETLASHASGDLYHEAAKGSGKFEYETVLKRSDGYSFNGFFKEKVRVRYLVRYRLDSYARAALSSTGIDNPLSVAWEVLPYSFVIDWFVPVSNFLKNLTAFDGFELVSGTKSITWEGHVHKDFTLLVSNSSSRGSISGAATFHEVNYDRLILNSFPGAVLPSFRNPLDRGPLWKTLTSLALLRQLFTAKPTLRL